MGKQGRKEGGRGGRKVVVRKERHAPGNSRQVQAVFRVSNFCTGHNKSSGQVADVCVVQYPAALGREGRREGGREGGKV